ncbi:MAG TPA: zinc ribbon domain-containing protein [Clostridiales bacterium]|nr:MAG: hypothetical protein BWY37_00700 [Firmicutes bacterium ADurb.Bin262]HOU09304.1 zinc ribbon domain-containing protein [Clostridiales bacterium]HQK73442.1 zinc ribbon domain-containing protein [Clostridiales bacterium]
MFCVKCGKAIDDDAAFCPYCGAKIDAPLNPPAPAPPPYAGAPWQPPGTPPGPQTGSQTAVVMFLAKKMATQFLLTGVILTIAGVEYRLPFGAQQILYVPPGLQTVVCSMDYMGRTGTATAQFEFVPGRQHQITYTPPVFVFSPGTLRMVIA